MQPSHVIPKVSEIHWALCVPSSCTYKEVEAVLMQKLKEFIDDPAVLFQIEVRENMCQMKNPLEAEVDRGYSISLYDETCIFTEDIS